MTSNYNFEKQIGRGSYGTVYKVTSQKNQRVYAIKKISLTQASHYEKLSIINELRLLATHNCAFIVKFKEAFIENGCIFLVTEYATNGDLSLLIKKNASNKTKLEN